MGGKAVAMGVPMVRPTNGMYMVVHALFIPINLACYRIHVHQSTRMTRQDNAPLPLRLTDMSYLIPTNATDFHREGFARFDNLLRAEEWQQLSTIYDELFVDPTSHPHFRQLGGTENGKQLMPQILAPHKARPELLTSPYAQRIAALARELLGNCAPANESYDFEPAGSPRDTPWHQDQSYHSPIMIFAILIFGYH